MKEEAFKVCWESGNLFNIMLNPRTVGVSIPAHLAGEDVVVLQFGPEMMRELCTTDVGLSAVLNFNRMPFEVFIPWDAVFALTLPRDNTALLWENDVPKGVTVDREDLAGTKPAGGHLKLLQGGKSKGAL